MTQPKHPPRPPKGPLADKWQVPVQQLVELDVPQFGEVEAQRHRLFSAVVMGIVATQWNGNRYGQDGDYGVHRRGQLNTPGNARLGGYRGGTYLGHNIAAIAVDADHQIIDFDLNHNDIFHRSTEHAEARLVRRVFGLSQVFDTWAVGPHRVGDRLDVLNQTTVYTSLESCSQCSGIMALGAVRDVVFLQRDPNQNSIGNILYNLRQDNYAAPRPIPADSFKLAAFDKLNAGFAAFEIDLDDSTKDPFFRPTRGTPLRRAAMTSFLCTDKALEIFETWTAVFAEPVLSENQVIRLRCLDFLTYVQERGMRGTSH